MDLKKGLERGPFSDQQANLLSEALSGLDSGQLQWLCGYFSAISQSGLNTTSLNGHETSNGQNVQTNGSIKPSQKLHILYGSHTGNCEGLAKAFAEKAKAKGIETEVIGMETFKSRDLKKINNLAILVSTHGIGEPPVQAEDLHAFLHSKKAFELSHINYSVLALGDSSYVDYCQTGKDFDAVLEKLGAKRICDRIDCDVDYEEDAISWQQALLEKLSDAVSDTNGSQIQVNGVKVDHTEAPKYTRKNPFEATIIEKVNLNGKGSTKETIHLEIDLEGSGLTYEPGDALGVYGSNTPALVEGVLNELKLSREETIESHNGTKALGEALSFDYELSPLTAFTLSKYAELTNNAKLKAIVTDNAKVQDYINGRDVLDLLKEAPHPLTAADLLSILRKNTARMYSIASAQEAVDNEVHLLVSVVRYQAYGRDKEGLCSATLADRLMADDKVKVFVDKNTRFKPPQDPNAPIVMIGPGTGIAPFRAFMQQREANDIKAPSWLFFGDRNFTTDFLYQVEWQQYLQKGILTKADVAFSRDQQQKEYVQHKMLKNGKELYDWLEKGAHFYVCGDAQQMAKDVDNTLKEIVQKYGGITPEKAHEYIKNLQVSNRYQTDVY